MVTTSIEAQELVSIARERSLLLSVFHNRRWDGDFLTVQNVLNQACGRRSRVYLNPTSIDFAP